MIRAALLAPAIMLSLLYINTAVIKGGGEELVVKPLHGLYPFYGGGEEGAWIRDHPNQELPWWHYPNQDCVARLIDTSLGTTGPPWLLWYALGWLTWILLMVILVSEWMWRLARRRIERTSKAT